MRDKKLILNYLFLSCLIVLFLNDHFFKFIYTSWFTGKLSDIVGIILFPMFLTYLFPKLKQKAVYITGLFFIFWKSPFSDSFIKIYNFISPIDISRVVDYSDLLVLLLLLIPYFIINNSQILEKINFRKVPPFLVSCATILVLMSTAPPRKSYYYDKETGKIAFNNPAEFEIKKTNSEVLHEIRNLKITYHKDTAYILSESEYWVTRFGEFEQENLEKGGEIFKIDNDSLRQYLFQRISNSGDYILDKIELKNKTVRNVQISIDRGFEHNPKKFSKIKIRGFEIDKNLTAEKTEEELAEIYKNLLTEKFKSLQFH